MHTRPAPSRRAVVRALLALPLATAALLLATSVLAAGTVQIANRDPQEIDGRWKLAMTINYGGMPHLNHVPMLFVFTPVALYERALTDQSPEKPVLTKIPLRNQQSINESMDVGFSDASGKTFQTTKFDFVIRRDRGFEAGEYTLTIKRAGDGVQVGTTQTLKLQGDNPVVDRRAIVFSGEKKPKAKDAEKKEGEGEAKPDKAEGGGDKAGEASEGASDPVSAPPADTAAPVESPPPVAPKQGGCGCRAAGEDGNGALSAQGVAALALASAAAARLGRRPRRGERNPK